MILKKGVTGYTGGDLSLECDWEARVVEFKRYSYMFVQQLKGEILEWYMADIDIGYAHTHIKIDEKELYIFHHNIYDYIAFTVNRDITGLEFIDHSLLKALFETRYEVLTAAQLAEPLVRQSKGSGNILLNENDLNDVELYYMDYFPAQTVGDLIFNYWD
ncbi:hypothetical protein [Ureibacillus sinduriensis]|uniref:Uncharacterized protein n=1 Tax=Ureibacillus sinduriensis BLB-1 = JCM 15800 TaxID=1384057 RepID=A0A0A3IVU4_9BACL|nr:hypothetical protein [Ureibacillus sinduriensis]KGR78942.1 hypothetical protein CD33_00695 [Ureibacillus sinduriensis BLB-1 = JCM 15800]